MSNPDAAAQTVSCLSVVAFFVFFDENFGRGNTQSVKKLVLNLEAADWPKYEVDIRLTSLLTKYH